MRLLKDFKSFAMRGNVLDLAVAVVIGAAFGRIVTSFVNDVLMPPIGLLLGGIDFTEFVLTLKRATGDAAAVTINYGSFIQNIVDFTIIAFAIFMVIQAFERMKRKEEVKPTPPPAPSAEEKLLTEIRDLLKEK
ncbi:large-conductance mechanosensitive channel protein MscL [Rhodohalobacter barkolensis]|uniref:Large-conductance mechanosensitive channel n=1 Tax=Rhodohalobacter barkolensis TaxID=2053187 RepID=A0A2N0VHE5_9BACT|nr:large-conductance mechanosensitive channel protein MscL [Rhodohalobacter barkolensis]PKD43548.1 large conductance mechanosensitive channel protein MscL [Rhodohalobacter barkolensis]